MAITAIELFDPNPNPDVATENRFGYSVVPLSNGNIAISSPFDDFAAENAGAVYLFEGSTRKLISVLRGSQPNDSVGLGGVFALENGNFVVASPFWNNGVTTNAGAVTLVDGRTGINGVVSTANSLVGTSADDRVGELLQTLPTGNYVVSSPFWNNGAALDAGAVTFGNGTVGVRGAISKANSLVGTSYADRVGLQIDVLADGDYVVGSPYWSRGQTPEAGASTFGSGHSGVFGEVSLNNSLVGSSPFDQVGSNSVTELKNGNYVLLTPQWDRGAIQDAGATTWVDGSLGIQGVITPRNSLVGTQANDASSASVTALSNGNYVVAYPFWDKGRTPDVGAVVTASGVTGRTGFISPANSLHGRAANDQVGAAGVQSLSNGNFVVISNAWLDNNGRQVGAATFGLGGGGTVGPVSPGNSLVGSSEDDFLGALVTALTNGNYVVTMPYWDRGNATDAGAITFGNGKTGTIGTISPSRSLVGTSAYDYVGERGAIALSNGNYVVASPQWDNGSIVNAGAVTFGNGRYGAQGNVSRFNSLIGSSANDLLGDLVSGSPGVQALSNGNYVIRSVAWDNGSVADAGAVTFGDGVVGVKGFISASNSLVGSRRGDSVGLGLQTLANGNYVVLSPMWDNGTMVDAGAITWGNGNVGTRGPISPLRSSIVGAAAFDHAGSGGILTLTNGNFIVYSPRYSRNETVLTFVKGDRGIRGVLSRDNSLIDTKEGVLQGIYYDTFNDNFILHLFSYGSGNRMLFGSPSEGF